MVEFDCLTRHREFLETLLVTFKHPKVNMSYFQTAIILFSVQYFINLYQKHENNSIIYNTSSTGSENKHGCESSP